MTEKEARGILAESYDFEVKNYRTALDLLRMVKADRQNFTEDELPEEDYHDRLDAAYRLIDHYGRGKHGGLREGSGRKPIPGLVHLHAKVTDIEKMTWKIAAERKGMSLSAWVVEAAEEKWERESR